LNDRPRGPLPARAFKLMSFDAEGRPPARAATSTAHDIYVKYEAPRS
jgi:hypothetical protein